jgi:hypothetical protein
MTVVQTVLSQFGLTARAGPAPMVHQLSVWVDLPVSVERSMPGGIALAIAGSTRNIASLRAAATLVTPSATYDFLSGLIDKGLIRQDPADAAHFQVKLGLRVVYPASQRDPNIVAGTLPRAVILLNHGHAPSWSPIPPWVPTSAGSSAMKPTDIAIAANADGYAYLQDALAAFGLISVSIDHNFACWTGSPIETRADTVIAALNVLNDQATDAGSRYFHRLDFSRIGLMGHSRGGDAVVRAVKKILADPSLSTKYTVRAVCSLAPTDFTGSNPPVNRMFLDINDLAFYVVLYGALDGDVSGAYGANGFPGTGFRHYDRARCAKAMVFLDACCHDYFNTVWTANPQELGLTDPRVTNPGNHHDVAIDYLTDLFRWQLSLDPQPQRFDGRSGNRAGIHASLQWMFGQQIKKIDDFENPTANLLGGTRAVLNIGRPVTIDDMASIVISGNSLAPNTGHQTHVLHVDLTSGTPTNTRVLTDDIPATDQDWSLYDTLIVSLSGWFDPNSAATIAAANLPRLRVTITDAANVSASADWTQYGNNLPSRPIFKTLPGLGNLTMIRLETIPIPLATFSGPDLTKIATVALDIVPDNGTHVFVDNIHVVQR